VERAGVDRVHDLHAIGTAGLSVNRLFLIEGDPGTGKTTLALRFLLERSERLEGGTVARGGGASAQRAEPR
jgi:KaiC/GvpD/RAD55 family RecA-like ATPase